MAMRRRVISLDPRLDDEICAAARESGESLSHWVAEAAAERLRQKYLGDAVDWFETAEGAFTPEEIEDVRRRWQQARRSAAGRSTFLPHDRFTASEPHRDSS